MDWRCVGGEKLLSEHPSSLGMDADAVFFLPDSWTCLPQGELLPPYWWCGCAHLARTARDWQKLTEAGSPDFAFFDAVKQLVKRGCEFHRLRSKGTLDAAQVTVEKQWLRDEQLRLETWVVSHEKALTLQARIVSYRKEWL